MSIEVAVPSSMVMLPYFPVETVVGSHLQASLAMKASNGTITQSLLPLVLKHELRYR